MCAPSRDRPALWLWSFLTAIFASSVQLWKTIHIFWFSSEPSFHLPGHWVQRKKKILQIFLKHRSIFPLTKLKLNDLIWFKRSSLSQDPRLILYHLKMHFRLISIMWLYDSQRILIRTWKMTVKFFILNTFFSIRVESSLFYESWKSGQYANIVHL